MKHVAIVAALGMIAWSHVQAEDDHLRTTCDAAVGAEQLSKCLDGELDGADKRLNAIYGLIMKMFDAGAVDPMSAFFYDKKRNLVVAERAWLKFRDAQCAAEAGMLSGASASGTVEVTGACLMKLTQERIAYLKQAALSIRVDSKLCEKTAKACQIE
jgi:uncharacterized protein YecT (DUF1311 family)